MKKLTIILVFAALSGCHGHLMKSNRMADSAIKYYGKADTTFDVGARWLYINSAEADKLYKKALKYKTKGDLYADSARYYQDH